MHNIKIKEFVSNGISDWFKNPDIYRYEWIDSKLEESDSFDEENQCMIEKTKHTYIISGIEEMFSISFYSEFFLTKKEFIKKVNDASMNGYLYEYNYSTNKYESSDY